MRSLVFLLLSTFFVGELVAQVNAIPNAPHLLVYGHAEALAIPDQFEIKIQIKVTDLDSNLARKKMSEYIDDALEKLQEAGANINDIVATSLSIEKAERYDRNTEDYVYEGIEVSRRINAKFGSNKELQTFLNDFELNQEVAISGVSTFLSSKAELLNQLRGKSLIDAREKAEAMADQLGSKIIGLYSVSDVAPEYNYGIQKGAWPRRYEWFADDRGANLERVSVTASLIANEAFQTGYVSFSDDVYIVFLISDK